MTRLIFLSLAILFVLTPAAGAVAIDDASAGDAGVSLAGSTAAARCRYHVYIPAVLKSGSGGGGAPVGFTPPDADFNGDGYADLAVGVPGEGVAGNSNAGAVNVLYGAQNGLSSNGSQLFTQQDTPSAVPEQDDTFGYALAAGDFDGNGCTDLAVGVPDESIGSTDDAGAVYVFYGTPDVGLDASTVQPWTQDTNGVSGIVEAYDNFGRALGAGDFDSDGYSDLVIGVPFEEVNGHNVAGAFHVLYGSQNGLTASGDQLFSQAHVGDSDDLEANDEFGSAFAAGDFDGDGYQDLAVGSPGEDLETAHATDAGAVYFLYGTSTGLTAAGANGFLSINQEEFFGSSLASGDFDADGRADLVIGAPNNDEAATNAGRVVVHYGDQAGLVAGDVQTWDQGQDAQQDEYFGASLTVDDFNADGAADLVIGVPGESSIASSAGAIWVLYGDVSSGLPSSYDQVFQQRNLFGDSAESNDEFAHALAAGDYDRSGSSDLAVGVPFENIEDASANLAGGVHTAYSSKKRGPLQLTGVDSRFWTQDTGGVPGQVEAFDYFGQTLR